MCLQFLQLLTSPSSSLACTLSTVGSGDSVNSETTSVMNRSAVHPPPGDLADPGNEPKSLASPALQADSLPLSHQGRPTHTHAGVFSGHVQTVGS